MNWYVTDILFSLFLAAQHVPIVLLVYYTGYLFACESYISPPKINNKLNNSNIFYKKTLKQIQKKYLYSDFSLHSYLTQMGRRNRQMGRRSR